MRLSVQSPSRSGSTATEVLLQLVGYPAASSVVGRPAMVMIA